MSAVLPALRAVLEEGQRRGSIGPGSIDSAVDHALQFFAGLTPESEWRCIDMGSGGGLPGLPLAVAYPETIWVLLDSWQARVEALRRAIRTLGLDDRVEAVHARAEDAGRGALRAGADVVVARSFGAPALTAECAAPLLRDGGWFVVSTAGGQERWPQDGVPALGLEAAGGWGTAGEGRFLCFRRQGVLADRFPRRPAAQRRAPLF